VIGSGTTRGGRPGRRDGHSHAHSRLGDHAHANPSHYAEGRADRRNAKERSAYRADACSYHRPTQGPVSRRSSAPAERHPSHNHQAGNALAASKNGNGFCHGNAEPSTNSYRIRGGGSRRLGMGSRERWGAGPLWATLPAIPVAFGAGVDQGSVQLPTPRLHALHVERSRRVRVFAAGIDANLVTLKGVLVKADGSCGVGS